jgi:Ca2+-dependent lipid-binding protein
MTNFPHVQTVELSFIEQPTFDYVLKPIGGETFGFDINSIPGLAPFIRQQVHSNLGPMMYDPNVFTIDLEALMSGTPLDSAIGVLKVHIIDARGLKAVKLGGGAPDPYVSVALGAKDPVTRTKTISSTSNPTFNETQFILINSLADILNLHLYDFNDHRPDNLLGTVTRELATLNEDAEQHGIVGSILGGGKERGELRYDLSYFPVLQPQQAADGTIEPLPETSTGIVRLTIHQAKDLDITREHGTLNPFVKVFLGGSKQPVHVTPILKRANAPIWESHCEFLVPEKHRSVISLQIIDSKELAQDPTLGRLTVKLDDLLEAKERQQDWLPLQGSRAGKVRMTAEWKPVAMAGSMDGAAAYVPPIGILRLWLKRAEDVKNVEAGLGGKSDPYVRVMGHNKVLARTEVVNSNLNPEWDQIVYVPIHNPREHIMLELMDYQNIGKDRSLGHVEINAGDFLRSTDDVKYPYASTGPQARSDRVKQDKVNAYKGVLHYEADFKPAVSLRGGVSFDKQKNDFDVAAEENAAGGGGVTAVANSGDRASATPVSALSANSVATNGPPGSISGHGPSASISGASVVSAAGQSVVSATDSKAKGEATPAENPEKGVVMSREDLMAQPAGVLVFQIISGQLSKRGAVEVMMDDGYWPSFTSTKARSTSATWDQIGEGFVRELEFSRIWLRVNADPDGEEPVAEFRCDTKDFLEQCLDAPHGADFMLVNEQGRDPCTIKMTARYVPVDIALEPRESFKSESDAWLNMIG